LVLRRVWLVLIKDQSGSLSTITALLMPALMAAAGVASDTLNLTAQQRLMQRQAEAAALAGAEALAQNGAVVATVQARLAGDGTQAGTAIIEQGPTSGPFAGDPLVVRVQISAMARLPFTSLFAPAGVPIRVEATAGLVDERAAAAIGCDGCQ
jgi:uncharacterized membrane protein